MLPACVGIIETPGWAENRTKVIDTPLTPHLSMSKIDGEVFNKHEAFSAGISTWWNILLMRPSTQTTGRGKKSYDSELHDP